MTWKESIAPLLSRIPVVRRPTKHVPFRQKMLWTLLVLVVYFYLTNVTLYGLGGNAQDIFGQFRSILAGEQGSILQLGIGPIVTASIVLQLLAGADLLGLDTSNPADQVIYQGLQKFLVILMVILTGFPMVFAGGFLPADPFVSTQLGVSLNAVRWIIFAQIFAGGIFILYMDEVVSKWGIGSGVGLFIVASVSQHLVGGIFTLGSDTQPSGLIPTWIGMALGNIQVSPFFSGGFQELIFGQGQILALITTLIIFGLVVYCESVRVEIPLSHSKVRGAKGRFPVKLIYASVLPMILVRAVQANIQFLGRILDSQMNNMPSWLGVYSSNEPVGGFFYYLNPIMTPGDWMWWLGQTAAEPWQILLRVSADLFIMVIGGAIFAIFWVETTNMGPASTAQQIQRSGMQIPGFRRNPAVLEKVMQRYIPLVTVVGGALVGFLAVGANMLGTIGAVGGTGLLLTVSIVYKLYEEIAEEQLMEMHPMMRQMFG
ncbi:MAG: preprotein translocase subunit SecY [Halobacteriales archaeon]